MPRKSKTSKRNRKRKYSKKQELVVPRGMPKTGRCKLHYCENNTLSGSSGNLASSIWRANGAADPRYAVGGHAPYGYNQWTALFNHYLVVGSKITVKFRPSADTPNQICGITLIPDASVPYTVYTTFIESNPRSSYAMLNNNESYKILTCKFSARKFFNCDNPKDRIESIGSPIGTTPSEEAFFCIWSQPQDITTTHATNCLITIEYIIDFSEPRMLVES